MKKKGLIIATIVMVLVLAVSLTTATYAWFTVSSNTVISGFEVSVESDRRVAIGLIQDCSYVYDESTANDAGKFMYGALTYSAPTTAGTLGGKWENGTPGLGDAITHDINWGAQSQAVGISSGTLTPNAVDNKVLDGATYGNTGLIVDDGDTALNTGKIIAANGQEYSASLDEVALESAKYAVANGSETGSVASDYAYLYLGVQAIAALDTNELIITLTPSDQHASPNTGILAAVHVAVKVNGGAWRDAQFYTNDWDDPIASATPEDPFTTEAQENAYKLATGKNYADNVGSVIIDLSDACENVGRDIAHVQIIIYIAGRDADCNNAASVNAAGNINIFFNCVEPTASQG